MIVDDDEDLARGIADILELEGHETILAFDGKEALRLSSRSRFDLVFLDVKLPDINGIQVRRELRDRCPELPIVMMTGFRIEQLFAYAAKERAVSVLRKPFTAETLLAEVEKFAGTAGVVMAIGEDSGLAQAARRALERAGKHTFVTHSAEEAIKKVSERCYDILVLDLGNSTLAGLDVYLDLDEDERVLPTIIVTQEPGAAQSDGTSLNSQARDNCLFKPFDLDLLVGIAEQLSSDRIRHGA